MRALLVAALVGLTAAAAPAAPPTATNVSQTALDSLTPVVAHDGALVHVAWIESEPTTDGLRATIMAARSTDAGRTFEQPAVVAPLNGYASGLQIGASGGRVHLAWLVTSYTIGAPASVAYARSTDGGATFGEVVVVNATTYPGLPDLVASADRVAIVWSTESAVWLTHSVDGGAEFASPLRVADAAFAGSARVALGESTAALVWIARIGGGRGVLFRAVDLESPTAAGPAVALGSAAAISEADVATGGDLVVAVWNQGGQLAAARSDDGGARFVSLASPGEANPIASPRITVVGSTGHVVWLGRNASLMYGRTADGRIDTRRLGRNASFPDLAARDGLVCVAWQARAGSSVRVRAATSTDSGVSFSKAAALTRKRDGASASRVAVGPDAPIVVFEAPLGAQRDVYLARPIDNSLRTLRGPAGV
jgi:hypothetical protein